MSRSPATRAADPDTRKTTRRAAFTRTRYTTTRCPSVRECRLRLSEANCTFPVFLIADLNGGDQLCAASIWTTTSNAGSMPRGACSSAVATRRTRTSRDSRGPSTWSRSATSTTPTSGDRCRCRVLPVPCRSANVRGGSSGQPGQGERRKSATDVRLDGHQVTADPHDGDAGHSTGTYIETGSKNLSSSSATRGRLRKTGVIQPTRRGLDSP
jgi:hypothetical protein